nr:hypothetical protein Iba_chr07dCG11030 [Ipomoea batatas]
MVISAETLRATAWCLADPALFSNPIFRAMKPDFEALEELCEVSSHGEAVTGELIGGFKEVFHLLTRVARGVLEGIYAGLLLCDGAAQPNLELLARVERVGSPGVLVSLLEKLRLGNGVGDVLHRHHERHLDELFGVASVLSARKAPLAVETSPDPESPPPGLPTETVAATTHATKRMEAMPPTATFLFFSADPIFDKLLNGVSSKVMPLITDDD